MGVVQENGRGSTPRNRLTWRRICGRSYTFVPPTAAIITRRQCAAPGAHAPADLRHWEIARLPVPVSGSTPTNARRDGPPDGAGRCRRWCTNARKRSRAYVHSVHEPVSRTVLERQPKAIERRPHDEQRARSAFHPIRRGFVANSLNRDDSEFLAAEPHGARSAREGITRHRHLGGQNVHHGHCRTSFLCRLVQDRGTAGERVERAFYWLDSNRTNVRRQAPAPHLIGSVATRGSSLAVPACVSQPETSLCATPARSSSPSR